MYIANIFGRYLKGFETTCFALRFIPVVRLDSFPALIAKCSLWSVKGDRWSQNQLNIQPHRESILSIFGIHLTIIMELTRFVTSCGKPAFALGGDSYSQDKCIVNGRTFWQCFELTCAARPERH